MIEINLLPVDRRPVERTPLPRFVALLVGILVVGAELFYAFLYLAIWIPHDETSLAELRVNAKRKKVEAEEADKYQKAIDELNVRTKAVIQLIRERNQTWVWTPILDHLDEPSVLPEEVWLTKFDLKPPSGRSSGTATVNGFVRGGAHERYDKLADFVRNLSTDEVIGKRFAVTVKQINQVELTRIPKEYRSPKPLPRQVLAFELELTVKKPPAPQQQSRGRTRNR